MPDQRELSPRLRETTRAVRTRTAPLTNLLATLIAGLRQVRVKSRLVLASLRRARKIRVEIRLLKVTARIGGMTTMSEVREQSPAGTMEAAATGIVDHGVREVVDRAVVRVVAPTMVSIQIQMNHWFNCTIDRRWWLCVCGRFLFLVCFENKVCLNTLGRFFGFYFHGLGVVGRWHEADVGILYFTNQNSQKNWTVFKI